MLEDEEGTYLEFDLRAMSGLFFEEPVEDEVDEEEYGGRGHNLYEGIEDEIEKMS